MAKLSAILDPTGVRVDFRDEMRVSARVQSAAAVAELGAWLAEIAPADFFVTLTLDPRKTALRRLAAMRIAQPTGRDLLDAQLRVTPPDVFASYVRSFWGDVSRACERPLYAVGGVESHKSGQSHGHLVVSVGEEVRGDEVTAMHGAWFEKFGYVKVEPVTTRAEVLPYVLKNVCRYVTKDVGVGQFMMSRELEELVKGQKLHMTVGL